MRKTANIVSIFCLDDDSSVDRPKVKDLSFRPTNPSVAVRQPHSFTFWFVSISLSVSSALGSDGAGIEAPALLDAPAMVDAPVLNAEPQTTASPAELPLVASPVKVADPVSTFFRTIALDLIPGEYEDLDEWGLTKPFQSGLDVGLDGLRIDTKRRYKEFNHGTWRMYQVRMADPERFDLQVGSVRKGEDGRLQFTVTVKAPLNVFVRQSEWRRGLQLYSVSANANALVLCKLDCAASLEIAPGALVPQISVKPEITGATVRLEEFHLDRISKIGGDVAEELGRTIRGRLEKRVAAYDQKLPEKINRKLAAEQKRLTFSIAALADSKFRDVFTLSSTTAKTTTP